MNYNKNENEAASLPKVFTFNPSNAPIRVQVINQEPWFIAKDVCDALNLTDVGKTVERLDEDEKLMRTLFVSGQNRQLWLVNESGLYNLIFQSRKPEAKAFRKWVTSEVLPSIRCTGSYVAPASPAYDPKNYCTASRWRHKNGLLPKKFREEQNDFLDLRNVPFEKVLYMGEPVRKITFEDEEYYSVFDIRKAFNITTDTGNMVRNLNSKEAMARKIFIFGSNNPGWFCTSEGLRLLTCDRTSEPYCPKKVLAAKGGL
jgi:prophage antirepressor-like protein